jgi:hypothetical protein
MGEEEGSSRRVVKLSVVAVVALYALDGAPGLGGHKGKEV